MQTLREKTCAVNGREGSILEQAASLLQRAPVIDCNTAVEYFLSDTPGEETFSVADIPLGRGIQWLAEQPEKAIFLEAEVGTDSGLGWGALLTKAIDATATVEGVRRAARRAGGIDVEHEAGDPGLIVMDPGVIERAGALIYLEDHAGIQANAGFYETLFSERLEVEELWGVLQVAPFAALGETATSESFGGVIEPGALWYLPLDDDGRVIEVAGDYDELMLFAPGVSDTGSLEDVMDFLAESQREFVLSVLFSIGCMGVMGAGEGDKVRIGEVGEDSVGSVEALDIRELRGVLENRGSAGELGLARALTVCRREFEEVLEDT